MWQKLSPEQIATFLAEVAKYIEAQRAKFAPSSRPLTEDEKSPLQGFFQPDLLDRVRVLELPDGQRVENPSFFPMLRSMGYSNLPDQSTMTAITFQDIIVSHEPFTDRLLFHELVHAEQYRQLGLTKFADLYVRGFLSGGSYETIPLEMNAYSLDYEYEINPKRLFSVADNVREWIAGNKY